MNKCRNCDRLEAEMAELQADSATHDEAARIEHERLMKRVWKIEAELAKAREELDKWDKTAGILAGEVAGIAEHLGIIKAGTPLTGPQLSLLAENIKEMFAKAREENERLREASKLFHKYTEGRPVDVD